MSLFLVDNFYCNICDYTTSRLHDYEKHLSTRKHKNQPKSTKINQKSHKQFICKSCNKLYKERSGLWRHSKNCKTEDCIDVSNNLTNLVLEVLKTNQELQKQNFELQNQVMKIYEKGTVQHINSHNKTFNLNIFLNEECKDAMNLMDFIDSLKLQLIDLEKVGELGYVNGISNIIINHLRSLDIHKRPVHCSDYKRETMYVKESNKWAKEGEIKTTLNKAIKHVANKSIRLIPEWKKMNPECIYSESSKSDQYNHIILESMDMNEDSNEKIIKNIAKEVRIDKEIVSK